MVVVGREVGGGGHCSMVAVSQYQINLLYQRWQMGLIQSYRERDEDYCVHIHPNHQFSVCVYITIPET